MNKVNTNQQYVCPICGNKDPIYVGIRNKHPYCRKCVAFRGDEIKEELSYPTPAPIYIDYDLSEDQKRLSDRLVDNYMCGVNTLVHAVCGSGKTEIVLKLIKYAINCGDKVGFAIPRREVVREIHERFVSIFKKNTVVAVYGGHTDTLKGDLVVLTTHQLYRYRHYFDLLIVDEIDAFPFNNNEVLNAFFFRSIKGKYVLMSATPPAATLSLFNQNGFDVVELFSRFHTYPLPVPELIKGNKLSLFIKLVSETNRFIKMDKPLFIFTPTIEMCEDTYLKISAFCKGGNYVHSLRKERNQIIDDFRNGKYKYLVTTAVLERGVTIKDGQVIIYHAEHIIYDEHALIQISGRVGRKKDAPTGEVIFLASTSNEHIEKAIDEIERANKNLQDLLQQD